MADVILTANEMRQVELAAFEAGIDAEKLMDHAAEGIANAILEREPEPGFCVAYLGKGNNAGDAIVAGSLLAQAGWEICTRHLVPASDLQPLPKKKLQTLGSHHVSDRLAGLPSGKPVVILDGLLGLGSRPELNAPLKALTREINALRQSSNATVYAIDLPAADGRAPAVPHPRCHRVG